MSRAFIALGSNLESPEHQIHKAFDELDAIPLSRVIKKSSLYSTAPVGYEDQPDFINAVVEIETKLDAEKLLMYLFAIENLHGRRRPFPNAPRQLDLDLLLYDDLHMQTPDLTIPHPRMHTRGFVLLPLAEIAPEIRIASPETAGKTIAELATSLPDQGVTRIHA
jgi:2-amino-4-hydroxy-6-hydroxymethyldihydropteridine diphosphokinase